MKMQNEIKSDLSDGNNVAEKFLFKQDDRQAIHNDVSFWSSKRFLVAILIFFGYFNIVVLKVNLNIAIVEMTSKKQITSNGNLTTFQAEFNWDSVTIGNVLSMSAYGYLTCVFGGYVVNKIGGAVTYGISVLIMSITNIITPASLELNFYLFMASRIIIGVLDGFAYTGSMEILSRWAPISERSTMLAVSFSGIYIGIAATYPVCGYIAYKWGWPAIFYVSGIAGIVWYIVWVLIVTNQPSKDKWISKKELQYILENTETTPRKQVVHPYREIFTSPQVWALCVGEFTYSCGFTLLVTCFPLFVKDMTGLGTNEVGLISSIPNVICMFMIPLAGIIMDFWQNNSNLKRTQIHKIMMSVGFFSGSLCFSIAAYSTSFPLSMVCFILIKLMISFNYLILQLVCLAMSPKHSSVLAGVSAFWYTVSVIVIPNVVGFVVQNHSLAEWSICFLLSAGVLFCGAIMFLIYGSSELQSWSLPQTNDTDEKFEHEVNKLYET